MADGAVEEGERRGAWGRVGLRTDKRSLGGETVRTRGADSRSERPSWGGAVQAQRGPGGAL